MWVSRWWEWEGERENGTRKMVWIFQHDNVDLALEWIGRINALASLFALAMSFGDVFYVRWLSTTMFCVGWFLMDSEFMGMSGMRTGRRSGHEFARMNGGRRTLASTFASFPIIRVRCDQLVCRWAPVGPWNGDSWYDIEPLSFGGHRGVVFTSF